jgi:hypothetical protein
MKNPVAVVAGAICLFGEATPQPASVLARGQFGEASKTSTVSPVGELTNRIVHRLPEPDGE